MISVEVRSVNGRPRASTPVTTSGTACTMRVLRLLRSSVLGVTALSDTISLVPSAKLPPESFITTAAVSPPQDQSSALLVRLFLPCAFRGRRAVCSRQETPDLLSYPDGPNQQVNRSLKKSRAVAFNAMSQKQESPACHKNRQTQDPLGQNHENGAHEDHRDAHAVQHLVPDRGMLVIVLRHIVRQARHSAPPLGHCGAASVGDNLPRMVSIYTQISSHASGYQAYSRRSKSSTTEAAPKPRPAANTLFFERRQVWHPSADGLSIVHAT